MLSHYPMQGPVAGGGPSLRFGVNMRLTATFPTGGANDGPEMVWALESGGVDPGQVPQNYTNANGISWTSGSNQATQNLHDIVGFAGNDIRLTGGLDRSTGTVTDYEFVPLANQSWRMRCAFLNSQSQTVECQIFDGFAATLLHSFPPTAANANEVINILGEVTDQATWVADYETKYVDLVITLDRIFFRGLPRTAMLNHLSLEPTP